MIDRAVRHILQGEAAQHIDFDTHPGVVEWWLWRNGAPSRYPCTGRMPAETAFVFEHLVRTEIATRRGAGALAGAQAAEQAEMQRLWKASFGGGIG